MNKKLVALIASAVGALAIIAIVTVAIIKGFDPADNNSVAGNSGGNAVTESASQESSESSESAVQKGKLALADVEAKVGKTVDIPITIKKNPGMWGGQIILKYDTELLEYVDFSAGDVFDDCHVNAKSDGTVYCVTSNSAAEDVNANGTVITLKFLPKPAARGKVTEIKISDDTNFTDLEENLIKPDIQSGRVTIE